MLNSDSYSASKYTPHVLRSRCGLSTWKIELLCDIVRQVLRTSPPAKLPTDCNLDRIVSWRTAVRPLYLRKLIARLLAAVKPRP